MSLKDSIQKALDSMKKGILNITKEMQTSERVEKIYIRNNKVTGNINTQTIIINGKYSFTSDSCINVNIEGDVHTVDTQGDVTCQDVKGSISTQGDVTCEDVGDLVRTQGDVTCRNVENGVRTMGDVICQNVNGPINTMGDVNVNKGN
jgi:hypothetical protein